MAAGLRTLQLLRQDNPYPVLEERAAALTAGVAAASVIAEYTGLGAGLLAVRRMLARAGGAWHLDALWRPERYRQLFAINANLFLRTLALMTEFIESNNTNAAFGFAGGAADGLEQVAAAAERLGHRVEIALVLAQSLGLGLRPALADDRAMWPAGLPRQLQRVEHLVPRGLELEPGELGGSRVAWDAPGSLPLGERELVPLRAGEAIRWQVVDAAA